MTIPRSRGFLPPIRGRYWSLLGGFLVLLSLPLAATSHTDRTDAAGSVSGPTPTAPVSTTASAPDTAMLKARVSQLPLYFIENQGQSDAQVAYYLHGGQTSAYFTAEGLTLALQAPAPADERNSKQPELLNRLARPEPAQSTRQRWAVKVQFVDGKPVTPQGHAKTTAVVSYFKGSQSDWKAGLPTYHEVVYRGVWPGIDVIYSGDGGQLKTTFHVQPGADPGRILICRFCSPLEAKSPSDRREGGGEALPILRPRACHVD